VGHESEDSTEDFPNNVIDIYLITSKNRLKFLRKNDAYRSLLKNF